MAIAGFGLVAIGWAGRRTPALYRAVALMLLNTVVLLAALELGAAVLLRVIDPARPRENLEPGLQSVTSYHATQSWGEEYLREADQVQLNYRYHPYQLWRMAPFVGRQIYVGADGLRRTPDAECVPGAYNVDVFGGSTVWGLGVPDWGTVPAYLQESLRRTLGRPVCVRNLGQLGLNSTQDLIALIGELRAGRTPDLAIFLSGVNEVITAAQTGGAGLHFDLEDIASRLEGHLKQRSRLEGHLNQQPEDSWNLGWVRRLNLYRLSSWIVTLGPRERTPVASRDNDASEDLDTLAQSVVQVWLENYRMVEALGREYRFAHAFFWQPNVVVGEKPRTDEEKQLRAGRRTETLFEAVTRRLSGIGAPEYRALHSLVNLFARDSALRYLDWHHLTPEGNRIVAEAIVDSVMADGLSPQGPIARPPFGR